MADFKDKKGAGGKGASGGVALEGALGEKNVWEFLVLFGVLIAVLAVAAANILGYLKGDKIFNSQWFKSLSAWFKTALPYLEILSFLFCIVLLYAIVVVVRRFTKLNRQEAAKYAPPKTESTAVSGVVGSGEAGEVFVKNTSNKRWERVLDHIESKNPNDWKIAIIESDSILDEMIKSMGYHGDNMGERMKGIEVSDFNTLNNAWDAHKVRNMIAHEGANFQLNEREARRVVALYKSVFEEFKYI